MSKPFQNIMLFTDGACSGNPGPGGWGAIVVRPVGVVQELGGKASETTNNRMELMGAIKGLASIENDENEIIDVYTDSVYVIRGITQWIWGWRTRGWKNAEGKEVSNRDLWEELSRQVQRLKPTKIEWKFVKGHAGIPGNERCDVIAVSFTQGKWVELYQGSILQYPVAIHDLPEKFDLPEIKPREAKAAAYSYLSLHGGIVMRHQTWAECERRVKGQSQAKFKKALSEKDEREILKGWGLNPDTTPIQE